MSDRKLEVDRDYQTKLLEAIQIHLSESFTDYSEYFSLIIPPEENREIVLLNFWFMLTAMPDSNVFSVAFRVSINSGLIFETLRVIMTYIDPSTLFHSPDYYVNPETHEVTFGEAAQEAEAIEINKRKGNYICHSCGYYFKANNMESTKSFCKSCDNGKIKFC
jgi:hypothetical protein